MGSPMHHPVARHLLVLKVGRPVPSPMLRKGAGARIEPMAFWMQGVRFLRPSPTPPPPKPPLGNKESFRPHGFTDYCDTL